MKLETFKDILIDQVERLAMSAEDAFERYEEAFARSEDGVNLYESGKISQSIESDFIKIFHESYEECEVI